MNCFNYCDALFIVPCDLLFTINALTTLLFALVFFEYILLHALQLRHFTIAIVLHLRLFFEVAIVHMISLLL